MKNLVELFCDVDDFCKVFIPQWNKQLLEDGTRKRQRDCRMSMSEIMTVIIGFNTSNHRDFKNYYLGLVSAFYKKDFPDLLSYTRFLEVMPKAIVPMCAYFSTLKGKPTGIEFIDSTSLKVCHNIRIPRHKTFDGIAQRGKGTMGWFYGFKLHLIVNYHGQILAAKVTTGNVHDTKPVEELAQGLTHKLYGDKGYLSKALEANLFEKGVELITTVRKNMKAKAMSLWDRAMLSKRFIIETPRIIMHQLEKTEGGLTSIEDRVLRELALGAGAREVVIYLGSKINTSIDSFNSVKAKVSAT